MAIVKCKVCGRDVDEDALKCPGCDSLGPKRGKKIRRNMFIALGAIVVLFGYGWYYKSQEVVKPVEQVEKEAREDRRSQRGVAASLMLRSRLANPASMKITRALSNEDGSNLCFEFTETDASGKRKSSKGVVYDGGEPSMKPSDWKLFCEHKSMRPIKLVIRTDDD